MVVQYIQYIFVLLAIAYFFDQINQAFRLNFLDYRKLVGDDIHNLVEFISECSLSLFSIYILINFDIKSILIRLFLLTFSVFYFLNGLMSLLLMFYSKNRTLYNINEQVFFIEFLFTKVFVFILFYFLYTIIF
jgi:hypothetical protein